jgi:transposase
VWLAAGVIDMRYGIDSLAVKPQTFLAAGPYTGHGLVIRDRTGDLVKLLWSDGDGMCLLTKRLERGRFVWRQAESDSILLSTAQLSTLLEGINWRHPERRWQPRGRCSPTRQWLTIDVPLPVSVAPRKVTAVPWDELEATNTALSG